jgi:hypothetical protein
LPEKFYSQFPKGPNAEKDWLNKQYGLLSRERAESLIRSTSDDGAPPDYFDGVFWSPFIDDKVRYDAPEIIQKYNPAPENDEFATDEWRSGINWKLPYFETVEGAPIKPIGYDVVGRSQWIEGDTKTHWQEDENGFYIPGSRYEVKEPGRWGTEGEYGTWIAKARYPKPTGKPTPERSASSIAREVKRDELTQEMKDAGFTGYSAREVLKPGSEAAKAWEEHQNKEPNPPEFTKTQLNEFIKSDDKQDWGKVKKLLNIPENDASDNYNPKIEGPFPSRTKKESEYPKSAPEGYTLIKGYKAGDGKWYGNKYVNAEGDEMLAGPTKEEGALMGVSGLKKFLPENLSKKQKGGEEPIGPIPAVASSTSVATPPLDLKKLITRFDNGARSKELSEFAPLDQSLFDLETWNQQQEKFKEAKRFHWDWMNSDQYKRMLAESVKKSNGDVNDLVDIYTKRKKNLINIPGVNVIGTPFQDGERTLGISYDHSGVIDIFPLGYDVFNTIPHEVSHSVDRPWHIAGSTENLEGQLDYDLNKMERFVLNQKLKSKKSDERLIPQADKDLIKTMVDFRMKSRGRKKLTEFEEYVANPTETRARLNVIRQEAAQLGIYDPHNEEFTEDHLFEYIIESRQEDGDPYNQLRYILDLEQIIELMNSISQSDSEKEPLNIAQKGGKIPVVKQRRGVRKNPDGKESSHLMMAEYIPERGWVAFPSLFQDSKPYADDSENWVDMSEEEDWMKIYEEAERRGEVYDFGEDKEAALAFGMGSWKDQLPDEYIDVELTDEEIEEYRKGGHVVEELPKAQYGKATDRLPLPLPSEEDLVLSAKDLEYKAWKEQKDAEEFANQSYEDKFRLGYKEPEAVSTYTSLPAPEKDKIDFATWEQQNLNTLPSKRDPEYNLMRGFQETGAAEKSAREAGFDEEKFNEEYMNSSEGRIAENIFMANNTYVPGSDDKAIIPTGQWKRNEDLTEQDRANIEYARYSNALTNAFKNPSLDGVNAINDWINYGARNALASVGAGASNLVDFLSVDGSIMDKALGNYDPVFAEQFGARPDIVTTASEIAMPIPFMNAGVKGASGILNYTGKGIKNIPGKLLRKKKGVNMADDLGFSVNTPTSPIIYQSKGIPGPRKGKGKVKPVEDPNQLKMDFDKPIEPPKPAQQPKPIEQPKPKQYTDAEIEILYKDHIAPSMKGKGAKFQQSLAGFLRDVRGRKVGERTYIHKDAYRTAMNNAYRFDLRVVPDEVNPNIHYLKKMTIPDKQERLRNYYRDNPEKLEQLKPPGSVIGGSSMPPQGFQLGGEFEEKELTDFEIAQLRKEGYQVEII